MKKYNIILADPPWQYPKSGGVTSARGLAKQHYATMTMPEIEALPIGEIAADNCYLFLWVTAPRMPEGLSLLSAWGFSFFTIAFTWIKTNRKSTDTLFWGMGNSTRANPEYVLLGRQGKLERQAANVHSVIMSPIQEHSQKPAEARERIEQLYGDIPRIELFARQPEPNLFNDPLEGWDIWGNEVDSDIEFP